MPKYIYEALDDKGRMVQGERTAPSPDIIIRDLKRIRYSVVTIRQASDFLSVFNFINEKLSWVNLHALAIFTRQFSTLFNAGVPLLKGLDGLSKTGQGLNTKLSRAINEISTDLRGGFSLSRAMAKHASVFSSVYTSLVKAGEMSGSLGEVLERLAGLLEKEYHLQRKVQSATAYPFFVFFFALGLTFFTVTYIFPKFITMFEGLQLKMPPATKMLILVTNTVKSPFFTFGSLALIVLGLIILRNYLKTTFGKRQFDALMLDLPLVGKIQRKAVLARFCQTLSTLLASGIPMMHALEVVEDVAGNTTVKDIIVEICNGMKAGMRLSQPMKDYYFFPPIVIQMVAVGEETGNLPFMLQKLSDFFEMEVEHLISTLTAMLEPFMILLMGCFVAFVLLGVFAPIYDILQKF